jgi:hypothetical protein
VPAKKLTPAQLAVLREAKAGTLYRSESGRTLYDSFNADHKNINRQVDALTSLRPPLLRIGDMGEGRRFTRPWHITEEGERILAEHDADIARAKGE